jgi:hypothetical protein
MRSVSAAADLESRNIYRDRELLLQAALLKFYR